MVAQSSCEDVHQSKVEIYAEFTIQILRFGKIKMGRQDHPTHLEYQATVKL